MSNPLTEYTIYTRENCGFCTKAKKLLENSTKTFDFIDVTTNKECKELLKLATGQLTFPFIFHKKKFIGGYHDLAEHLSYQRFITEDF